MHACREKDMHGWLVGVGGLCGRNNQP